jgi:hypothetical protein
MKRFPILAVCVLLAAPLHADEAKPKGEKYALLVGCSKYNELPSLKSIADDVPDFANVLRQSGWPDEHIVRMHDGRPARFLPEGKKIRKELELLLAGVEAEDFVVVALSGHGVKFKENDHGYFCPADAKLEGKDTLLSLADVYDLLFLCKARRKLLLVQACRWDDSWPDGGQIGLSLLTKGENVPKGVAVLFSCSAGQVSYGGKELRHGVFFHYILQGWQGDANPEGPVTLGDLVSFVRKKTKAYMKTKGVDQAPTFIGDASGEWVLSEGGTSPEAEAKSAGEVERLGGKVIRDEDRPGRPVVEVRLSYTKAGDSDLKALAGLKRLRLLALSFTPVTDEGLKNLSALKGLEGLYLNDTEVTDARLRDLAGLKGLRTLYLGGTGVTDIGLKELTALKGLQTLKLHSTSVTAAGVKELQAALPELKIDY